MSSTTRTLGSLVQVPFGTCLYACIRSEFMFLYTDLQPIDTPSREFYTLCKILMGSRINSELKQAKGSNLLRKRRRKKHGKFESLAVLYFRIVSAVSYFCRAVSHTINRRL
jgi:hypothetical protein